MNTQSFQHRAPAQLMLAGILSTLALAATADANVNVPVSLSGPAQATAEITTVGEGAVNNFSINVTFNNQGNFVYASDLIIGIVAPNGAAVEFGGQDLSLDGYDGITFADAGTFPATWRNAIQKPRAPSPVASFESSPSETRDLSAGFLRRLLRWLRA